MYCRCFNCGGALSWQGERCRHCDWKTATCIVTREDILEALPDAELAQRAHRDTLAHEVYGRRIAGRQKGLDHGA